LHMITALNSQAGSQIYVKKSTAHIIAIVCRVIRQNPRQLSQLQCICKCRKGVLRFSALLKYLV
jgi:hypothetical protein